MKFFKNFKKNEIVIYAIALMLVTAGYFNYTTNLDGEALETYSENVNELANDADIGDARLVDSSDVIKEDKEKKEDNNEVETASDVSEENTEDTNTAENEDDSKEEIAETNSENVDTENTNEDYFVDSKLKRDTNYASMISTYTKILEDTSVSETEKAIAMKEITKINNNKNAISICENILSTKGFTNSIILVNDNSINIVVELDGKLTTDKVAQIQNIISREFDYDISKIHITER